MLSTVSWADVTGLQCSTCIALRTRLNKQFQSEFTARPSPHFQITAFFPLKCKQTWPGSYKKKSIKCNLHCFSNWLLCIKTVQLNLWIWSNSLLWGLLSWSEVMTSSHFIWSVFKLSTFKEIQPPNQQLSEGNEWSRQLLYLIIVEFVVQLSSMLLSRIIARILHKLSIQPNESLVARY